MYDYKDYKRTEAPGVGQTKNDGLGAQLYAIIGNCRLGDEHGTLLPISSTGTLY